MLICVFGYYNKGNAGDDRLQTSLVYTFSDHTLIFLPHMLPPPLDLLQRADMVLIGGGGLVFDHSGIWQNARHWLDATKVPVGLVGLGINRLEGPLVDEVKLILDRCEFAMVRDAESAALAGNHPKLEVGIDLSWLLPQSSRPASRLGEGIATNLLFCDWQEYDPKAWGKALQSLQAPLLPFPFRCVGKNSDIDIMRDALPGVAMPDEFVLEPLQDCELAVVCRFHAAVFALQMGVPFLAIGYDFKVSRLMKEAGLEEQLLATNQHDLLPEKVAWLRRERAAVLSRMDRYAQSQRSAGLEWRNRLQQRVNAVGPRKDTSMKSLARKVINRLSPR